MTIDAARFKTPGQLLRALIKAKGWNQRVFGIVLGVSEAIVGRMVKDTRPIDAEMAIAFSALFDIPAERFLQLQREYDLAVAMATAIDDPGRATRARLFGSLPIAEMVTRGWLPGVSDFADVSKMETALAAFFDVSKADDIEILPHAAKRTNVTAEITPTQLAWLYRVRQLAKEMVVPAPYSPSLLRAALSKLSALLWSPEEARKAPRILAESGVRFVVVESLSGAKIDGACFWLNDVSPVIGMSLRYDRIDNFWFVLRHECEHILRSHGKATIAVDTELERERAGTGPDLAEEERVANEAAASFCVPPKKLESFIARKAPIFSERDIVGFANTIRVHPGIVAGQLQRHTGKYERFRSHLARIRGAVLPSAFVDGWGDVAPVTDH